MASNDRAISKDELAQHAKKDDCWVVISGGVYDVTAFQKKHPGGAGVFTKNAGADATKGFDKKKHSPKAKTMMQEFKVGVLQ